MDKRKILNTIHELETKSTDLHNKASNLAVQLIESEARRILNEHKRLNEFVMGMGHAFFTDRFGVINNDGKYKFLNEFNDLVNDLDEVYHVTGEPMRFTAKGEKITNW